jgi:DNA-directed RNA polymerase specialized sigma24 family protein
MSDLNDNDLLFAFLRQGNERAFTTLVERHAGLVFGSALRPLGDRGAAEEVTQSVFTTLARKAQWLTGQGGLAGWLYRSTVLEVRFRQRTEVRRRAREQTAIELGTTMETRRFATAEPDSRAR